MNLFKDVNPFQLSYGPLDAPTIIFQTHVDLLSFEIKPIWQRRINNNITIQPHGVIRSTNLHILIIQIKILCQTHQKMLVKHHHCGHK